MWSASWARARGKEPSSSIARPTSESGSRAKENDDERRRPAVIPSLVANGLGRSGAPASVQCGTQQREGGRQDAPLLSDHGTQTRASSKAPIPNRAETGSVT